VADAIATHPSAQHADDGFDIEQRGKAGCLAPGTPSRDLTTHLTTPRRPGPLQAAGGPADRITSQLEGKQVLLTGATGFLGKVSRSSCS
jgi:hypothetical protein